MADESIRVTVAVATAPEVVVETAVRLAAGSTVRQALAAADCSLAGDDAGIWGRAARPDAVLRDGDRVEVCRPLRVDPQRARRERFQQQGARATGLFARRRDGAKAGY